MQATTVGVGLAKSVFQTHGVDPMGKVVLRRQISKKVLRAFFAQPLPCLVGLKACGVARTTGHAK
jgi:transposase